MKSVFKAAAAVVAVTVAMVFSNVVLAVGDLTRKPQALPDLGRGNEESDYSFSENRYELETGTAYKRESIASGLKEYDLQATGFFASIYLRKEDAGGMEIKEKS